MKSKKSPKADLEPKRGLFLEIGFVLALVLVLAAFEWSSDDVITGDLGSLSNEEDPMEMIAITKEEPPPPKQEPPKQEPEKILLELKVVDDDKKVKDIDWNSEIKNRNPPKIIISDDVVIDDKLEAIPWHEVKDKPLYPGGEIEMLRFIQKNSVYPSIPKENGVEGKVYVKFVIDETGKVKDLVIMKSIDPYLEAEALRVVSLMPDWTPGKQRGVPVPVTFILPINFDLQ